MSQLEETRELTRLAPLFSHIHISASFLESMKEPFIIIENITRNGKPDQILVAYNEAFKRATCKANHEHILELKNMPLRCLVAGDDYAEIWLDIAARITAGNLVNEKVYSTLGTFIHIIGFPVQCNDGKVRAGAIVRYESKKTPNIDAAEVQKTLLRLAISILENSFNLEDALQELRKLNFVVDALVQTAAEEAQQQAANEPQPWLPAQLTIPDAGKGKP